MMIDETTTEQLAEIEGQEESTPATGYTPPEGWRVVRFGEQLLPGDVWVSQDGTEQRSNILHWDASAVSGGRCIRRIEPEPQPEPVQVREGRWRTRSGEVKNIRPCEPLKGAYYVWPWTDGFMTFQDNGLHQGSKETPNDLVEYLGPIEQQPETQSQPQPESQAATIEELRSEVSYVQRLLGESNRKVAQLEDLVGSLRTINVTQEKAFTAAGKENTALRNQLAAVKAELVQERLERNRWHNQVLRVTAELDEKTTQCEILQIELDAAQQVPPDSPELRQLRADLAEVTRDRDTYRHAHELLLNDVNATHQRTKVMTIEAIVEWLVPIRTCGSQALATAVISNLPHIMRSVTGLEDEEIE